MLNHHGLTFPETESALVDFAHRTLTDERERFGIRKILNVTSQHGSYSFYFQDRDTNWWEIETLKDGFNPWQRVSHQPGSEHLLKTERGSNTVLHPFR